MNESIQFEHKTNTLTTLECPHCNDGKLIIMKDLLSEKQYKHNEKSMDAKYNGEFFSIHDYLGVIAGLLQCSNCNDFVSFVGKVTGDEEHYVDQDGEHCSKYISYLNFQYISPSIHIIPIHTAYPELIHKLLDESFSFYLNHSASCVNKLRILIEEVLNDLNIQKKAMVETQVHLDNYLHMREFLN